LENYWLTTD